MTNNLEILQSKAKKKLQTLGFDVYELTPEHFRPLLEGIKGKTAGIIFNLPPFIAIIPEKHCYLVDIKQKMGIISQNYTFDMAKYDNNILLHTLGTEIIIIFEGWRADFIQYLQFSRIIDDPLPLKAMKNAKKPYGLIQIDTVRPFDEFFGELLAPLNSQINLSKLM